MGGWGELRGPRDAGAGTSGQIEQAHDALDAVGIHPGPLAVRALAAAEKLDRVAPVAELAEGLYRSGALDGIIVADVRFAELVRRARGAAVTGFGAVRGPSVAPEGARPKIEVELELPVDITVEDHVETTELGDGLSRCAACGYRWPCPEVRLQPRPLDDAELDVLEALEVGPGFAIERRLPEGADYTPFRGVIVRTFEDVEGHRTHRVLDFRQGRPVFQELHDEDIEPATVGLPNDMVIREAARRLAANIGKRRGMVDSSELELLHDAIDLLRTVLL